MLVGSKWKHYLGGEYVVIMITNRKSKDNKRCPATVVYQNVENKRYYNRPLSDWHRSMLPIKDD